MFFKLSIKSHLLNNHMQMFLCEVWLSSVLQAHQICMFSALAAEHAMMKTTSQAEMNSFQTHRAPSYECFL